MKSARNLIAVAQSQLGYLEKLTNEYLDDFKANPGEKNYTKYARDLHDANFYQGNKQGHAWCAVFVTWCAYKTTGSRDEAMDLLCQLGLYGAGCEEAMNYYIDCNAFDMIPRPGDQIFFTLKKGEISHTGIVETVGDNVITTIEGNTTACVARRVYSRMDPTIVGYGHPKYDSDVFDYTEGRPDCMVVGSEGEFVRMVQWLINNYTPFNCGEPDGIFGKNTELGVKEFQAYCGLETDGEVGPQTWAAIDHVIDESSYEEEPLEPVLKYDHSMDILALQEALDVDVTGQWTAETAEESSIQCILYGRRGTLVRILQILLNRNGATLEIDGDFGEETEKALLKYQLDNGLDADGRCEHIVWMHLLEIDC